MSAAAANQILEEAEILKKRADIHFAKSQYEDAVVTYTFALKRLAFLAGLPFGEIIVARCFSNQAQCYLKMNQYDNALASINMGFTVPSVAQDTHMLSKLFIRKSLALEALGHYEEALKNVDKAIALGIASENFETLRAKMIQTILSQEGSIIPIAPKPIPMTTEVVSTIITHIFISKENYDNIMQLLHTLINQRAWLDHPDDRKNNIMWAVSQAAVVRAQNAMNGDEVYSILELLVEEGEARAEQRFPNIGNKTALQVYSMAGAVKCVELLLKHGASVHTLDDDGWSSLLVACAVNGPCSGRNSAVVDVLIKAKSNVNHRTKTGLSAIAAAAQSNDESSVKLLLDAGSSFVQRCALGFSPIIWAKIGSNGDISPSGRLILDKIHALEDEQLKFDMIQDLRCYDLAQFLIILKSWRDHQQSLVKLQIDTSDEVDFQGNKYAVYIARDLDNSLVKFLLEALKIRLNEENLCASSAGSIESSEELHESSFINVLEYFQNHINMLLSPVILTKLWYPKDEIHEDYRTALAAAQPIEQSWLQIMTSAIRGPHQEQPSDLESPDLSPPIETFPEINFYFLSMYKNFRDLFQYPICRTYSFLTPTNFLMQELLELSSSITFIETLPTSSSKLRNQGLEFWFKVFKSYVATVQHSRKRVVVNRVFLGLWDHDAIDLGLLSVTKVSPEDNCVVSDISVPSDANRDGVSSDDLSNAVAKGPCVVLLLDSILNESLIYKTDRDREDIFRSVSDSILEQYEMCADGHIVIIGATAKQDTGPLAVGIALLLHEFSGIIMEVFTNSSSLTLKNKIALPSWPFEDSFAAIFSCLKGHAT